MRGAALAKFVVSFYLALLKMIFIFVLGPGSPGEGPDSHFPKEIVGFWPMPARTLGFLIFILAISTARLWFHINIEASCWTFGCGASVEAKSIARGREVDLFWFCDRTVRNRIPQRFIGNSVF